ncbi:MAG: PAS domain S-box protein [Chitinophagaceae bacterium]|nr:MAG: PAS domain S-box protein [Chitinophagaceae bacterium]
MSNSAHTHYFMSGGGVAGELLRSFNWNENPLGDPASWPQNLKTAVGIIINARSPMLVWWGPSLISIYNDAYMRLMGDKLPNAFGQPAKKVWSDMWEATLKPLVDTVFEKGESVYGNEVMFLLESEGIKQELYFTFSYSPVFDEGGSVSGLFCACHEDTVKVVRTRRLNNLSELKTALSFEKSQEQICIGAIDILRRNNYDIPLATVYRLNPSTQTGTRIAGYGFSAVPESFPPSIDLTQPPKGPFWDVALEHPFEWRRMLYGVNSHVHTIENFYTNEPPDKALKFCVMTEPDAAEAWLFFLGTSPHQKMDGAYDEYLRHIQAGIQQSIKNLQKPGAEMSRVEQLVAIEKETTTQFLNVNPERNTAERNMYNLLMHAPVAIAIYRGRNFVIELANERMLSLWDNVAEEVLNKPLFEVKSELQDQGFDKLMQQVMENGEPVTVAEMPVSLLHKGESKKVYVKLIVEPLRNDVGEVTGVMVLGHDITDQVTARKQAQSSEIRFRDAVNRAPFAMAILRGENFVMEITNDAYLALVDRKPEEMIGQPISVSMPELNSQGIIEVLRHVYTTGEQFTATDFPINLVINGELQQRYVSFVYIRLTDTTSENFSIMAVAWDVTDLVRARFEFDELQRQFSSIFRESPMGMAVLRGEDLIVEQANKAMLQDLWQLTEAEIVGRKLLDVFPELDDQKYPELLRQVLRTGVEYREHESRAFVGSGLREVFFDLQYTPLIEREANINRIMVTAYDVTNRVNNRKIIQEAEERSRLAIEATGLGTFDWDLRTKDFRFSQRLADIFGCFDKERFTHQDLINKIHPDDLPVRNEAVARCLSIGWLNYQVRIIWEDGSLHWVSIYGKVVYDNNNVPMKMYGTALDISNERNYQDALEKSETKFRSLSNFMPQFIWTTDGTGQLTYFNQAIIEYSGLTEEEMQNGGWIQLVHPDERMSLYHQLLTAFSTGEEFSVEARLKKKDGSYRWQLARSVALRNDGGEVQMWIGTSIDIHERKMMAEELEKRVEQRTAELKLANEELIRTNQELEQFAYVSSHDLQEPLRKIQTFSDLLDKRLESGNDEVRLFLNKINASARRMSVLINDLLNYSRVSRADENFVAINLNRVLQNVSSDFEVLIKQKNAVVRAETLPIIRGIPIQVNQLFYNLLSNALKFSGEKPVIKISSDEVSGDELPPDVPLPKDKLYVVLHFEDNGIGFEQIYASQIFTIFQRLNNRSQYSGTGIGLAICKKIAETHEGYIMAESQPGKGATFHVYLAK